MTARRNPRATPTAPAAEAVGNGNGGELSTYSRFRDRLLLGLAAVLVTMMGYFVHTAQVQADAQVKAAQSQLEALRGEIKELRDKGNGQFQATTVQIAGVTERVGSMADRLRRIEDILLGPVPLPAR